MSRSWDVDHTDSLTDVVYGAGTELPIELFGSEAPKIMNGERPQVEHVVTGKRVSLLQHNHPSSHEAQLNRCPETTWPRPYDHTLTNQRQRTCCQYPSLVLLLQRHLPSSKRSMSGRLSCEDTYGGVSAGSALLVLLMGSTPLQFSPESIGPPVLQTAFD